MIAAIPATLDRFYVDDSGAACEQQEDARIEVALEMKPEKKPGGKKMGPHVSLSVWGDTGKYVLRLSIAAASALTDRLTPVVNALLPSPSAPEATPEPPLAA